MSKPTVTAITLILFSGVAIAPAVAKPPPAGVWEQFHFRDAKGHMHTVTDQVQIPRAAYADQACNADLQKHAADEVSFEQVRHPEIAGMTFASANCEMDKSGKIRIAVGAWPAGGK